MQTPQRQDDLRPTINHPQSPVSSDDPLIPRASGTHAGDNALYRGTLLRGKKNIVQSARTDDVSVIRDVPMPVFPAVRPGQVREIPTFASFIRDLVCSSSV